MRIKSNIILGFFGAIILLGSGCATTNLTSVVAANTHEAEQVVTNYLSFLNQKKYSEARKLFGGSYDVLQGYNSDTDTNDEERLLKHGCEYNGLNCLPLHSVISKNKVDNNKFIFTVQLKNNDGTIFKQGPCCGETEETSPPVTEFIFTVKYEDAKYLVLELPPYTP